MLIRHKIEDRYYLVFESLNKNFLAATDTPTRMDLAEEVYDLQGNIYKHPCFSTVAPTEVLSACIDAACSDGHCVFKVTKAQKQGMHTNGGCQCLYGLSIEAKKAIRLMSSLLSNKLNVVEALAKLEKRIDEMPIEELMRRFDKVTPEEAKKYARLERMIMDGESSEEEKEKEN
jgi:hypothetical protein